MTIKDLKPGDQLAIQAPYGSWMEIHTVATVGAMYATTKGGIKVNMKRGRVAGERGWGSRAVRVTTPQDLLEYRIFRAQNKLKHVIVTPTNIEAIEALIKGNNQ